YGWLLLFLCPFAADAAHEQPGQRDTERTHFVALALRTVGRWTAHHASHILHPPACVDRKYPHRRPRSSSALPALPGLGNGARARRRFAASTPGGSRRES